MLESWQSIAQTIARRFTIPTMREVAEHAGVSVTTISHIINDTRPVSDELRQRVLAAMQELGYQPNRLARSLRRGETHTIGMIIPDSVNPFFAEVARGIEDKGFEEQYSVIICNSDGDLKKELLYTNLLTEKQVDGIIFVAAGVSTEHITVLRERKIPVVVVDRQIPGVSVDSVLTDNTLGGWQATHHLIQLGHKRIGCIRGPSALTPSADRLVGYRKALEEEGYDFDEALIVKGDFQYQSGHQMARRLLELKDTPTAIFACNDLMAMGAICAATEMDLRIPEDLSVVGFDDVSLASFTNPTLTTIAQPKYEMGVMAVEMLIKRIRAIDMPIQEVILDTKLVLRKSTAAPTTIRGEP